MPAFGRSGILTEPQIGDAAEYVLSLSGKADDKAAADRGAKISADNCTPCHGADGKGNEQLGAPNLTDELWLYAGDKATVMETIRNGRGGAGRRPGPIVSIQRRSKSWPSTSIRWAAVSSGG